MLSTSLPQTPVDSARITEFTKEIIHLLRKYTLQIRHKVLEHIYISETGGKGR